MQLEGNDWPTFGWISDIRPCLESARRQHRNVVLGTITRLVGSSPRPAGTQMVFDQDRAGGYFSGGCLEADVANHAAEVLRDRTPKTLLYGQGSPWIDIRLLCGGTIEILLESIDSEEPAVAELLRLEVARIPALWRSDGYARTVEPAPPDCPTWAADGTKYSLRYDPKSRLVVVGGDPTALALAKLASDAGFETYLIRGNGPGTTPPIGGLTYLRTAPAATLHAMSPDPWTAVVSVTHDDVVDDDVVTSALRSSAGYIGVLGARSRIGSRRDRLIKAGFGEHDLTRIHAPIGIAGCGKTPWEIAVSIVAEIMKSRNLSARAPESQINPAA